MFEGLTIAAVGGFIRKNWIWLALLALAIAVLTLAYCSGGSHERAAQDQRTIKTQEKVGKANETAAGTRVEDQKKLDQQGQELKDALAKSTSSDDARRRAGCAVLRQQGRDITTIPACR